MATREEFLVTLAIRMKGVSTLLAPDEYSLCVDDMLLETGWAFPITSSFQLYWAGQRSKRHCIMLLLTSQAPKFQVDKIRLDQRFDHYKKMVEQLDMEFKEAKEENPTEFSNAEIYMALGHYINAGFAYDSFGRDVTYDETNKVLYAPNE